MRWRAARYNPELFDVLRALCDPARSTVDVGAHNGVIASHFALYSREVHAFEPNPLNFRRLARLAGPRFHCYEEALSDRAGRAVLTVPVEDGRMLSEGGSLAGDGAGRRFEVATATLDGHALADVGFLKIDVEGAERAVLAGAAATIERCRPVLFVEIMAEMVGEEGLRATVAQVCAMGYRASFPWAGRERDFAEFDPEAHQYSARRSGDMRRAAVNFIFRPQSAGTADLRA